VWKQLRKVKKIVFACTTHGNGRKGREKVLRRMNIGLSNQKRKEVRQRGQIEEQLSNPEKPAASRCIEIKTKTGADNCGRGWYKRKKTRG